MLKPKRHSTVKVGQSAWIRDPRCNRYVHGFISAVGEKTITVNPLRGKPITDTFESAIHADTPHMDAMKDFTLSYGPSRTPTGSFGQLEDGSQPADVQGPSGRIYSGVSLFFLKPADPPRKWAIKLAETGWFESTILTAIVANCCTMAWDSKLDPLGTAKASFISLCEWVFLAIFTFELLLKVTAYGFITSPGAYLRDAWCKFDSVVVLLAWLPILLPAAGNFSVIRAMRALRPLRALKRLPGMPSLVASVMNALPKVADVAMLCGFLFVVFGVGGVEMYMGALHYRCAVPPPPGFPALSLSPGHHEAHLLRQVPDQKLPPNLDSGVFCTISRPEICEQAFPEGGSVCGYFATSTMRTSGFDNFGAACITLLKAITFDSWSEDMHGIMANSSSFSSQCAVVLFFLLVIALGGFFLVNLFLAVIFQVHLAD